jgi:hypothetical protein
VPGAIAPGSGTGVQVPPGNPGPECPRGVVQARPGRQTATLAGMSTPGGLAALWDAVSAIHDELVAREEAIRHDLNLPVDIVLAARVSGSGDLAHLYVSADVLDARLEEIGRVRDALASLLGVFQFQALRDHQLDAHPTTGAPSP